MMRFLILSIISVFSLNLFAKDLDIIGKWMSGRSYYGSSPEDWCNLTISKNNIKISGIPPKSKSHVLKYNIVNKTELSMVLEVLGSENNCFSGIENSFWRVDVSTDAHRPQAVFIIREYKSQKSAQEEGSDNLSWFNYFHAE